MQECHDLVSREYHTGKMSEIVVLGKNNVFPFGSSGSPFCFSTCGCHLKPESEHDEI